MGKPISINNIQFKSKKSAKDYIRALINRCEMDKDLEGEDLSFVLSLLEYHHEYLYKRGVGIASIYVSSPPVYSSRCFYIKRLDGSTTDFSWITCIDGENLKKDVLEAFRTAIKYQIDDFRAKELRVTTHCPYTGEALTAKHCHVDHVYPNTFINLVEEFVWPFNLQDVRITPSSDNQYCSELADPLERSQWQAFHLKHAKLRLLSPTGNLSHAKKINLTTC